MTEAQQTELLFSYGTLQQESVQLFTFCAPWAARTTP